MAHSITHGSHTGQYADDFEREHDRQDDHQNGLRDGQEVVNKTAQKEQYGKFHLGAAFYGWVVASGIGIMLTALLAALGSAVALTAIDGSVSGSTARTVGLVSGALLVLAMTIAYFAGGYVAGRLSRFAGARQGIGVWAIGIIASIILGLMGTLFGSQFNLLQAVNLPSIPIGSGTATTAGLITSAIILVATLLAAISGAKAGQRYHRKVDQAGIDQ